MNTQNAITYEDISKVFEQRLEQLNDGIKAADRLNDTKAWEMGMQRRDELIDLWGVINSLPQTELVIDYRKEA